MAAKSPPAADRLTSTRRVGDLLVGVDLGGTGTRIVAVRPPGQVIARDSTPTPRTGGARVVVDQLVMRIRHVCAGQTPTAVGIGASGPIDTSGIIRNPATLPAYTGIDLRNRLRQRLGVPVSIDNDAVTAAYHETTHGPGAGYPSALVITLGTGVGVCVISGGKPFRGADGTHPEAGHLTIPGTPAPCYCGRASCWEQLASRAALQTAAGTLLGDPAGTTDDIRVAQERAQTGHQPSRDMFTQYGHHLADGITDLLTIHRPACVIIGGGAAAYYDAYAPALHARLNTIHGCFPPTPIHPTANNTYAGAIGATVLARRGCPGNGSGARSVVRRSGEQDPVP